MIFYSIVRTDPYSNNTLGLKVALRYSRHLHQLDRKALTHRYKFGFHTASKHLLNQIKVAGIF